MSNSKTILVVEDYSDTRTLLSAFLRAHGYRVIEARDGKEGFIQANRVTPDLILMDLALPEMDGVETSRRLRQRHALASVPIFVISAYVSNEVRQDALLAGCTEVFGKPFDAKVLLERIARALTPRSDNVRTAAATV